MTTKFITTCFIKKNTPEVREKLEQLGYEALVSGIGNSIFTFNSKYVCVDITGEDKLKFDSGCINCDTNETLFLAIAALTDENSYRQWYICKISNNPDIKNMWHFCERSCMDEDSRFFGFISFRKATVDELIEHFK